MTIVDAIQSRHSVRKYTGESIAPEIIEKMNAEIAACNEESGLKIQLLVNEPKCFDNIKAYRDVIKSSGHGLGAREGIILSLSTIERRFCTECVKLFL